MRCNQKWCIPTASSLLLLCALCSTHHAAAQVSCTVTYNCHGSSGCASVVGGGKMVTQRTVNVASPADCTAQAARVGDGTIASCNCGGGTSAADPATVAPAAPGHEFDGTIKEAISAGVAGKISVGNAIGFVGVGMLGNALLAPTTTNPAQQQQQEEQRQLNLAAQQLNNSGLYLFKQKNYAGAVNEFQQALADAPNDPDILHNLALATQQLKNVGVAKQTSGALSLFLGKAPAKTGTFDFDLLTHSSIANPNASALSLVNLFDAGVVDLRGTTSASPESLKSQLDGVLASYAPASAPPDPRVVLAQVQDIDQILQPTQATTARSQMDTQQKQLEDIFTASGGTDSAALVQQARLGQMATAANSNEDASGLAKQGFDTAAPKVVVTQTTATQAATVAPPQNSLNAVDLSQSKQPLVPRNLKSPPIASSGGPEVASLPITVMRQSGSGGLAAPGAPIFDCEGDRATISRMMAGLPAQEEAIRRTEEAMKAAKAEGDKARTKATLAAVMTLLSSATTVSNWAETVIAKVEGLKAAGISGDAAAQFKFLQHMKKILDTSNKLVRAAANASESGEASHAGGNAVLVEETARNLQEEIEATKDFLGDSKHRDQQLEELAGKVALYGFGPIGGLTGEALVHTIASALDLIVSGTQTWNSAGEAEQAERNLTVMRYQQMLVRARAYELQQEVAAGCSNATADKK